MNKTFQAGLQNLRQLSNNDEAFVDEMLEIFQRTTPKTLKKMRMAFEEMDHEQLADGAHKLKSSLQVMGDDSLKELTKKLEHGGRHSESWETLSHYFEQLEKQMMALNQAIVQKLSA